MLWFGFKKKVKLLEKRLHALLSEQEEKIYFENRIERTLLIGEDEEILDLIDQFSELNNYSLASYYDIHKHLDHLEEYTLVGSIARLKGLEEEMDSSIHLTPTVTLIVIFITAYVALSQITNSLVLGFMALILSVGFLSILIKLSTRNRKGRKRITYFRHLLEYQLHRKRDKDI
ncbi:hypothetical protein [Cytobacillus purgationiresistens]|uniref:Uncharacterized protein n=1 Tax=Cytobacillus purgationiresistens TaxID=863449 RepID=A0ABU0AQ51_9BACI|nr:hypothetical protein [Cytobacillus purgationiresistens]MDQ0272974.1 hypothetical protein [Cytobacillus purgationiresistens]